MFCINTRTIWDGYAPHPCINQFFIRKSHFIKGNPDWCGENIISSTVRMLFSPKLSRFDRNIWDSRANFPKHSFWGLTWEVIFYQEKSLYLRENDIPCYALDVFFPKPVLVPLGKVIFLIKKLPPLLILKTSV